MTDFNVSTAAQLNSALTSAHAGDVIRLAAGDYGDVSISKVFSSAITITSADTQSLATFHTLVVSGSQGVHLDNIGVNFTPTAATISSSAGLRIDSSSDITFTRGWVHGGNAITGVAQTASSIASDTTGNVIGYPAGYGINITLVGGAGADVFHTSAGGGIDRVLDFHALEGDRVQLDAGTVYVLSQVGSDTVINITGGAQMTLVGVDLTSLKAGWIFGA